MIFMALIACNGDLIGFHKDGDTDTLPQDTDPPEGEQLWNCPDGACYVVATVPPEVVVECGFVSGGVVSLPPLLDYSDEWYAGWVCDGVSGCVFKFTYAAALFTVPNEDTDVLDCSFCWIDRGEGIDTDVAGDWCESCWLDRSVTFGDIWVWRDTVIDAVTGDWNAACPSFEANSISFSTVCEEDVAASFPGDDFQYLGPGDDDCADDATMLCRQQGVELLFVIDAFESYLEYTPVGGSSVSSSLYGTLYASTSPAVLLAGAAYVNGNMEVDDVTFIDGVAGFDISVSLSASSGEILINNSELFDIWVYSKIYNSNSYLWGHFEPTENVVGVYNMVASTWAMTFEETTMFGVWKIEIGGPILEACAE
jgi:hypothetical protein